MKLGKKERDIVNHAKRILRANLKQDGDLITSSDAAKDLVYLNLCEYTSEVFGVMFLNTRHQVIKFEEMHKGTVNSCPVYPREIVKRALELNAKAVVLAHNHPSGSLEPSIADRDITDEIVTACNVFDINVIDHMIVAAGDVTSFAEKGLL